MVFDKSTNALFSKDGRKSKRVYEVCEDGDFNRTSSKWTDMPEMTTDRWYPTIATLGDGRAIILGGSNGSFSIDEVSQLASNPTYEYYPSKEGV